MARFTVLRRVDAFIDYVAFVDANSAKEASAKAAEASEAFNWRRRGEAEFDARVFFALDDEGNEIAESSCGDF